jgi:hypothetical protein
MNQKELNTSPTPEEQRLGYEQVWIENPLCRFGGHPFGEPHVLEALAYKVSESVWIFKMNKPLGGVYYAEMQYGTAGISERAAPIWQSCRKSSDDPAAAIEASKLARLSNSEPAIPPMVLESGGHRRIYYFASQMRETDFEKHRGRRVKVEGRDWIEFPVR